MEKDMDEEKRRQIVNISGIAFTCFKEVMEHCNEDEKEFINNNFDIFINIFNDTVLTAYDLLTDKELRSDTEKKERH